MQKYRIICLMLFAAAAWAQAPQITSVFTFGLRDTSFGPGTEVIILGTFVPESAGRDYTITVANQTTGINVAANGVFILATIPPTASAGTTTLVITYQGQASNALPITVAALAPEFTGGGVGIEGNFVPPQYNPYYPFTHYVNSQNVTPTSPAARGEVLQAAVFGIGQDFAPSVQPTITVGGQNADVLQVTGSAGRETIYFAVPDAAPLGIDPVVAIIDGVSSNTASLPVGAAPAIGSVLSAASFGSPGLVSPGSIVSVFGAGFGTQDNLSAFPSTSVNGVSVLFGTTPVPIFALAANEGQINVLVPTELPNSGTVSLTVQDAGGVSTALNLNLAPATPGIFYYGDPLVPTRRNAVAVTANTAWIAMPLSLAATLGLPTNCAALGVDALCAQPAARGGYLQIYVTGLGKATPNGDPNGAVLPTGTLAPINGNPLYETVVTPTVTIGGQPAAVLFSGVGPGYNGLYQVDVQIPSNITPGNDVLLQITVAGATDSATVAIQ